MRAWSCLVALAGASYFDIQLIGGARKCYTEDLASNTLIIAEVEPRERALLQVEVSLREPHEVYFSETSQQTMKTAFTMQTTGTVDVCVRNADGKNHGLSYAGLRILTGTLAKDFSSIAQKEHLDPVINELRSVESMLHEFNARERKLVAAEAATHRLIDAAHSRVIHLAVLNVLVIVVCNVLMAFILKAFFKSKKII